MEEDDKIRLLVNEDIASNSQTENTYTGKMIFLSKKPLKLQFGINSVRTLSCSSISQRFSP